MNSTGRTDGIRAADICAFVEQTCIIPEGRLYRRPLKLLPFQKRFIKAVYDNPHGPTRTAILSTPRKNSKTALSACLMLAHLCGPPARRNNQLYSCAQSRSQAALIFDYATKIIRESPTLAAAITVKESAKTLLCPELGSVYRALSADASNAMGLSPAFVVFDELGQTRGPYSPLFEAMQSATAAQSDPLCIVISTQSQSDRDLLSLLIDDAMKGHDKKTICHLYTAPLDLNPFSREAIEAANPALDSGIMNIDEVLSQAAAAERMPTRAADFRNLVGLTASPRGVWARGRCGNWIIFLAGSGQWGPIAIQPKGDSKCHRCVCG